MTEPTEPPEYQELQRQLAELNKQLRRQERQLANYGELVNTVRDCLLFAQFDGHSYDLTKEMIDDLRAALARLG